MRARGCTFELVVVENGSTDDTAAIADGLADAMAEVVVVHRARADYGHAIRAGLLAARGEAVVLFDVDYYDLAFVDAALARLAAPDQPAIVVGSKRAVGARDGRSRARRLVTWVFTTLLRWGFGLGVSDTHGMKALRRRAVVGIEQSCRFGTDLFDTELILRVERAGDPVVELPVVVVERRPSRSPLWRRVPRTLGGLVRLRVRLWRERAARGAGSPPGPRPRDRARR
jgi:glycosyltransferase involved in cell wall biosynthesis